VGRFAGTHPTYRFCRQRPVESGSSTESGKAYGVRIPDLPGQKIAVRVISQFGEQPKKVEEL
jgi:hypothetical protein